MKNTKVPLVPLTADDREQFILDNQWAFKYGAMMEFGERDDHIDDDGEIISRATIEKSIDNPTSAAYYENNGYDITDVTSLITVGERPYFLLTKLN